MSHKPKVFVTRNLPEEALAELRAEAELEVWPEDRPVPREVLQEKVKHADGLLCLLTDRIDAALLAEANRLKIVSQMAVGYDNIEVKAATERGIWVTNTPGVLTETTADLVFALLLATSRRIVEASNDLRRGGWTTWSPMQWTGPDVWGATLGIIGMGRIGEAVAKRASGFGMKLLYHNRSRRPEAETALSLTYASLDELLKRSDNVSTCIINRLSNLYEGRTIINLKTKNNTMISTNLSHVQRHSFSSENSLFFHLT